MARRSNLFSHLNAMARESARRNRMRDAQIRRQERERIRSLRETERLKILSDKEARQDYLEKRALEVEDKNEDLAEFIENLKTILEHTLKINDTISFDSLRSMEDYPPLTLAKELTTQPPMPSKDNYYASIKAPSFLGKLMPGSKRKYQQAQKEAEEKFQSHMKNYEMAEAKRKSELIKLREEYDREKQLKIQQRNKEVDELKAAYFNGHMDAVITYNSMVLESSEYPKGFPQKFRLAYIPEPKELVIDYDLPPINVVPKVLEYKFVKAHDEITEKPRKASEIKEIYQDVVASVTLRSIHEIIEADQGNNLQLVTFSGHVQTVDPSTGKDIRPCLISVRVIKDRFNEIDLSRIDKLACLRNLVHQVSPRPSELQPVKPIIEFDMADKRFVDQEDILTTLDARPNLMDLNPFEFENLITNLFSKMGLDAKQTRSSKDGGVDTVAFDTRPIVGGKVVIQAKRYKNVVGVSAVRDLYGTMINEGANKGILVTTSNYGPDAYDFSKDKPIELVDGGGLLYLLEQNGIKARIVFPDETK